MNVEVRLQSVLTLTESFATLLILFWRRPISQISTPVTEPQHRMHCALSSRLAKHRRAIMRAKLFWMTRYGSDYSTSTCRGLMTPRANQ